MNRQDAEGAKKGRERLEPSGRLDKLAYDVIGAAIEVHRHLGPGFLESVYEEALAVEFELRGLTFERQLAVSVKYKDRSVGRSRLDLLVQQELIVELKTVEHLAPIHTAQVLSYLKALNLPLALLINFNVPVLKQGIKRILFSENLGALGVLAVTNSDAMEVAGRSAQGIGAGHQRLREGQH